MKILGVLGSGQMGSGIAQVAASSGFEVVLYDISAPALEKARSAIDKGLEKLVQKQIISAADKPKILALIKTTSQFSDLEKVDIAIEAVTEAEVLKTEIFKKLDETLKPDAILASNTSSISITKLGAATRRPGKVVGMHFFNPVPLMKLVEGIRGLATSDESFQSVRELSEKMGKTFVESRDSSGFVVNRILLPMINEAVFVLQEGVATAENIDTAMKLGTNQPMGPLTLADFIGLDTCLSVLEVLHKGLGDPKFRPCPLLRKYVEAGWLGKKTGRGFFKY